MGEGVGERAGVPTVTDVIVIGTGVAGLAAAYEASRRGRSVVLAEAAPSFGGASIISGGGCCIVGTPVQLAHGVHDDPELALSDWSARGGATADLQWAHRYLSASRSYVFDFLSKLGVRWEDQLVAHAGNSVPRWHRPSGGGRAVVEAIAESLPADSVTWLPRACARSLVAEGDRVRGVVFERDGTLLEIRAISTIVATGGFVSDRDMLRRHGANLGEVEGILSGSGPMSTGSGHRLVEAAGAEFTNMADIWLYPVGAPDPRDPSGNRGLMVRGLRNEIWVNSAGRRFHNELERGHSEGGLALLNQPGRYSWGIADSREISSLVLANDSYYGSSDSTDRARRAEFLATSSHVRQAASLGQLAAAIQVPTAELRESVEAYNVAVRAGADVDPMTGRDLRGARTIETGALTAIQYRPLAQKNLGGVRTDLCCRVMTSSGRCFIGLYAAGEVAGMAGGHINGASGLEGTMFGPSLYSGRIAGAAAAADIALGGTQRPH